MTTVRAETGPPSMGRLVVLLVGLPLVAVFVVIVAVVLGSHGPSGGGVVRAYTATELDREVATQLTMRCAGGTDPICRSLRRADAAGGGFGYGPVETPTARCRGGVSEASPSTTCLVYSRRGRPVGPVDVTLVVTSGTGDRARDGRPMSFLQIS
ncbi:hypothetical protein [Actinomycetospora sp. NBRC 106375]|uniref:hypothetical protein n=1 Tax=Actinomycetospora sp. NBRC 106375 TaxID=3032207 RepID=UPI002557378E|nr:hypothetical protein [Actinomycetospora sp. NBRC 106375]